MADLEYRANVLVKIFTDVLWYTAQLSVFEVMFRQTTTLAGWDINSTRVFMGMLFFIDAHWMLMFSENLDRMSDKIRRGDLDLLLTKPVSSQFVLSFQRMNTAYVGNIFITGAWLFWALTRVPGVFSWTRLLLLIILLPCSLIIVYSLRFFFAASAVMFTRSESINHLWYQIYRVGTRPDSIYPPWLRYLILTVIPVGFIASVPARLILAKPNFYWLSACLLLAAIFFYLSTRYWRFVLRFYSSASS